MLAVVFVAAVAAFLISAFAGGGAGLILLPLLALVLPTASVPAGLSIGTTFSSISRLALFRRHIRWDVVRWFLPAALPGAALGASLLTMVDLLWLELAMGFYLLSTLGVLVRPAEVAQPSSSLQPATLAVTGLMAGFVSGLTGAVGVLFNRLYLRHGLAREQVVATRAANELTLHVLKLGLYIWFGLVDGAVAVVGLLIAVAAMLAAWLSRRLLALVSNAAFRRAGYVAMVVCGVFMSWHAASALAERHEVTADLAALTDGAQATLHWGESSFALTLNYREGLRYEHTVSLDQASLEMGERVLAEGEEPYRFRKRRSKDIHAHRGDRRENETPAILPGN